MKAKLPKLKDQRGVTILLVAVLMIVFLGMVALSIDLFHLYVVRNELQNAADGGALAGARVLYNDYGTEVNVGANQVAFDAATANASEKVAVDVNWTSGNTGDVERGHWSFATHTFTPNASTVAVPLWNVTTEELDNNTAFINAVRVVARRQATPAASFFARIFGYQNFQLSAEAVGYIGFAGTLGPGEADQPIAICKQSLKDYDTSDDYLCNIGRMLNSGSKDADHNTAGWTNFSQPCQTASTDSMRTLLDCVGGNPYTITLGGSIGATGGVEDAIINHPSHESLMRCWKMGTYVDENGDEHSIDRDGDGWPDMPWNMTLPVIDCPGNNVSNCSAVVGAVNVNVVWILEYENNINCDAPYYMGDWDRRTNDPDIKCKDEDGVTRWNDFVTHFNLQTVDGLLATVENDGFKKKSIYFLPDCTPHELKGNSGGENFGVLAKRPKLVK
jgi:Flp pilus assembly protein TadG